MQYPFRWLVGAKGFGSLTATPGRELPGAAERVGATVRDSPCSEKLDATADASANFIECVTESLFDFVVGSRASSSHRHAPTFIKLELQAHAPPSLVVAFCFALNCVCNLFDANGPLSCQRSEPPLFCNGCYLREFIGNTSANLSLVDLRLEVIR